MISQQAQLPQPPRIATWLVTLFAPADTKESVLGDLIEEFSSLVTKFGFAFARNWYWRQTVRTILHFGGSAFRAAPWTMLVAVIGGMWLIGFSTRFSVHAMRTFLDAKRVYESHPDAYLFWLRFPLESGRVLLCTGIGALVAFAARRREVVAVTTLALAEMGLFVTAAVTVIAGGHEWLHWLLFMLRWNGLCWLATIVGGVLVRIRRSSMMARAA